MKNIFFRKVLFIISIVSLVGTIISAVLLPVVMSGYTDRFGLQGAQVETLIFIYTTIVPFVVILFSVVKLSKNLLNDNSFSDENLKELNYISICSLIDFLIYLVGLIFIYKNLLCLVLTFATLMVFLLSYVIKELIKNGIEIKEENDLTI